MAALLPRDDPAPFFFGRMGVTSRHLLAAEVYWGLSLVEEPFFFEFFFVILVLAPCLSCFRFYRERVVVEINMTVSSEILLLKW